MAKVIMIQGTMSGAGKSLLVAGLCRVFRQDGYRVAPFKSQNMALNSFITDEGLEMGRAQVMQAEAAGIAPKVCMNPILLKPTGDKGSQVIVNGEVLGNMEAREYFAYKKKLLPQIEKAFKELEEQADIIVIEGAGSPAEVNLKENDIVNMGMARLVGAPVLLVGDIDRGGVFAQLLGTLMLLDEDEKERVKGLIINKFRGDASLLDSGVDIIEEKGHKKVVGIVPYADINLDDEDSLSERFEKHDKKLIDIVVVRLPKISNFTDFAVFEQMKQVSVRYVSDVNQIGEPDMIILPGSKNTIADMRWLSESGMADCIKAMAKSTPVFGICGGYQMLGESIEDPFYEEEGGQIDGLSLLRTKTVLGHDKVRLQINDRLDRIGGVFSGLSGRHVTGYEIHMGKTVSTDNQKVCSDQIICDEAGLVYGTYIHGIFDSRDVCHAILESLAARKNADIDLNNLMDQDHFKQLQYDKLADIIRDNLDMKYIYEILEEASV